MESLEKVYSMPALYVVDVDESCQYTTTNIPISNVVVYLLSDDKTMSGEKQEYEKTGENITINFPKHWIGKQALIRYERNIEGYKISHFPSFYPKIMQIHGKKDGRDCLVSIPLNVSEDPESLKIDYAPTGRKLLYTMTFDEYGSCIIENQSDDCYKLLIEWLGDNGIWDCDEIIYYDEGWNRVGISHIDNPNIIRLIKN